MPRQTMHAQQGVLQAASGAICDTPHCEQLQNTNRLHAFLQTIFPETLDRFDQAFIEVRILSDQEKDKCYDRRWYASVDSLMNDWEDLSRMARDTKACIAFSPALRKRRSGKKVDVLGSWCVWNDQNQRDGGKAECLQRLQDDELDWLVVDSGFAAHGYILLEEFCDDIEKIERANRLLQSRMGGDNVWDASRMLRVPGAVNFKEAGDPRESSVILMPERRYRIDELLDILDDDADDNETRKHETQMEMVGSGASLARQYDPLLQRMDAGTLAMVFETHPVGDRSEHDLAVVNRLVVDEMTDEEVTAIFTRYPCGQKAREGSFNKYMDRTISKARGNGHLFVPSAQRIPLSPGKLRRAISEIAASGKKARAIQEATSDLVRDFFNRHGKFFTDRLSVCHLHYQGKTFILSDNRAFRSLLQETCGLSLEHKEGKVALDRLANQAFRHGQVATTRGPVFGNRTKHTIYVHPGGDGGEIIKVMPGEIRRVENGANDDNVCLMSPPEMSPFTFDPQVDVRSAIHAYRTRLVDLLACDETDRLTIMLWFPNILLLGFSPVKTVMKMSGPQASGKTVACRLIGIVVAGADIVKIRPTAPSIYADPLPLQILDNVENKDLRRSLEDIILFSATGGAKEKMRLNTDDERIRREINCLLLINGIESLDRSEILSRIYEVQFDRQYQISGFMETDAIDGLLAERDRILSGLIRLMADHVLPRIASGGIREWKTKLDAEHPNHHKQRSFEFLARMGLIAEAVASVENPSLSEDEVRDVAWSQVATILERQGSMAAQADAETNTLANLFHALARERTLWDLNKGSFLARHHLEVEIDDGVARVVGMASDLLFAFEALARHTGVRGLDVRTPRSLAARLASDRAILEASGIAVAVTGKHNKTNIYEITIG
ncbi:MAG: hypothetical protein ACE5EQ_06775 [Phycisphaerae bacterium]